jgi:hypothetical protein
LELSICCFAATALASVGSISNFGQRPVGLKLSGLAGLSGDTASNT